MWWYVLRQDSQLGLGTFDGEHGVEKAVFGLLEALESAEAGMGVGDAGAQYGVLRNDRGGVNSMPDWPRRCLLGVYGDDFLRGADGGGGGVVYPNPNTRPALGSRVGVVPLP